MGCVVMGTLVEQRGVFPVPVPECDPISFLLKSTRIGLLCAPPPQENPGSATGEMQICLNFDKKTVVVSLLIWCKLQEIKELEMSPQPSQHAWPGVYPHSAHQLLHYIPRQWKIICSTFSSNYCFIIYWLLPDLNVLKIARVTGLRRLSV